MQAEEHDRLLEFYKAQREKFADDAEAVEICDRAEGIINRHDASYVLTQPDSGTLLLLE
jgi:hypothetical protein